MTRPYAIIAGFLMWHTGNAQSVTTILDASTQVDDALFLDQNGNLYGSHYMGSNVYRLAPDGTVTTFVAGLNTPNGIAQNSLGEFLIADNLGNRIVKVAEDGTPLDTIAIVNPSGLLKQWGSDTIIVTTYNPSGISLLAPDGSLTVVHNGAPLNGPVGLAYTSDGVLYVGNFTDRRVYRVSGSSFTYVATVPGPSSGILGFICAAGNTLYGTGWSDHSIYAIDPAHVDSVWRVAGGNGPGSTDGTLQVAQFNQPNGIIATATGDTIYVSDFNSKNIRMITGVLTGIDGMEFDGIDAVIHPNPTRDNAILDLPRPLRASATAVLRTVDGREVDRWSVPAAAQRIIIHSTGRRTGVYLLQLVMENSTHTYRVVKE